MVDIRAGWFLPNVKRVRVYHYGVEGRRRSLCGRFNTPDPRLLFPEVNHQKCSVCIQGLREINWRREDKAILLLNKIDLVILAMKDRISDLLSLLEFEQVESILEEIRKLSSSETPERLTKREEK